MKILKKKYHLTNEEALPVGDDKGTQNGKYYLVFAKKATDLLHFKNGMYRKFSKTLKSERCQQIVV